MRFLPFLFGLLSLPLLAAEPVNLRNDREGETYYSSESDKRAMAKAIRQVEESRILDAFHETVKDLESSKLCSYDLNSGLLARLKKTNPKFSELNGAIIFLRTQDEFDDVVTKQLLLAHKTTSTYVAFPKRSEELFYPADQTITEALRVMAGLDKKMKNTCFDELYNSLYGDILKFDKYLKTKDLEAIFVLALNKKVISQETYMMLEKARLNDLETNSTTLKSYFKKVQSLRTQYPLRDKTEKSGFVTEKVEKQKFSRRQRLMETYSDLQIMLMANVIKRLRTRLESPKVEILIYDRNQGVETIPLEPMERFRLAVKLLRKEMSLLALNTYFAGRAPDYMDLMVASYETGIIPASELDEVAGLEEIWNPKRTFWDKAQVWVRTFGSVATIALPPPYGFIPALAIVIIEMTVDKKDNNTDDPTVLF